MLQRSPLQLMHSSLTRSSISRAAITLPARGITNRAKQPLACSTSVFFGRPSRTVHEEPPTCYFENPI
jgi:hypothetical protein